MKTCVLASLVAALALAPGSTARPEILGPGVLLLNSGRAARTATPGAGLYRISTSGSVRRLIAPDLRPLAVARTGAVAAVRVAATTDDAPLILAVGGQQVELPGSRGAGCAGFSADGSLVSYLVGRWSIANPAPHVQYTRVDGALWVAPVANPTAGRQVAVGAFARTDCPLWSPVGRTLAYIVQRSGGAWQLVTYRGGVTSVVETDRTPVPSVHDRSFAWSPKGGMLAYLRGSDLLVARGTNTRSIHRRLPQALSVPRGERYARALGFSPNGRLVAASFGARTGVVRLDGRVLRAVHGHLREWSGNGAVLTNGLDRLIPTLLRFALHGGRPVVFARHFKVPVVADPAGAWFAYALVARKLLVFRRADGSLLRTVRLPFIPNVLAAAGRNGRISEPPGSY